MVSFVSKWVNTDLTEKQNVFCFFYQNTTQGKILSPMCICWGKMWKSNEKYIFHIKFHVLLEWSMPRGSSSIIAQSLKTLQPNGPKLVYTHKIIQTTINACLLLISYHCEKKNCRDKNYATPGRQLFLLKNTMTGTNSSNDRLILSQNVEINSNWYFSYDVFSGMKSSTTWNGNAIAQSPRKMSWVQRYFKYEWYTIFNGLLNDHRCNSSFIHHL